MKKILMFPQNKTHLENMKNLHSELIGFDIKYLNTNNIFHQGINFSTFQIDKSLDNFTLYKAFYNISFLEKLKFIKSIEKQIIKIIQKYDIFICGNDGAIQRIFIYYAKKYNIKTFIILDGMISNYELNLSDILVHSNEKIKDLTQYVKIKAKTLLFNTFRNIKLNFYIPSNVGCSEVDGTFVMGLHSKKVLEKLSNNNCIYDLGLPRYSFLKEYQNKKEKNQIIYLTGAFRWHNYHSYDKYQHQDISLLIILIEKLNINDCKLIIKVHPRDNIKEYEKYKAYNFVDIIKDGDVFEFISESKLIVSHISTTLVESLVLNKKAISMMINFPYWKFNNSFISSNSIKKVYDNAALENELLNINNIKTKQKESNELFSESSFESSKLISKIILQKVQND